MAALAAELQEATGEHVQTAYADQGLAGQEPAEAATTKSIRLIVVRLEEAGDGVDRPCACLCPRLCCIKVHDALWAWRPYETNSSIRRCARGCDSARYHLALLCLPDPSRSKDHNFLLQPRS